MDLRDLKRGDKVAFSDSSATTSTEEEGVVEGIVNDDPITDDAGEITHIRVWAERDNGREATTIIVAAANVLGKR